MPLSCGGLGKNRLQFNIHRMERGGKRVTHINIIRNVDKKSFRLSQVLSKVLILETK